MNLLDYFIVGAYGLAVAGLFFYGMNNYYMIFQFVRHRKRVAAEEQEVLRRFWERHTRDDLPLVTVQLPIYNERYVIRRLLGAVTAMDYPRDRLEIQVLDDSTDDTADIAAEEVSYYRDAGFAIHHLRREVREGFKAGALRDGLRTARGEYIAFFDADFIPHKTFLLDTVPFLEDPRVAFVQTRWGHINGDYSFLTRAQTFGMDAHFVVEQTGRNWSGLFFNFNGTGGIWRAKAIHDAGGWKADTLTEDIDLSYRAQLRGWKVKYLKDVVTPSEIPVDINAYKSQQQRWAKGSIQTAIKLLPSILRRRDLKLRTKWQATLHLTHYLIHPFMLILGLFAIPVLGYSPESIHPVAMALMMFCIAGGTIGYPTTFIFSQRQLYPDWKRKILYVPSLMCIGTGLAISNVKAVLEAFSRNPGEFVRTPKFNIHRRGQRVTSRRYGLPVKPIFFLEFVMANYCLAAAVTFWQAKVYLIVPFLLMYVIGFGYVSVLTLIHSIRYRPTAPARSELQTNP